MNGIKCRGIKKAYGKKGNLTVALKGIDLDVEMAKLTILAGPSGSGKTTLLSIITHLLTPDEGKVYLLGCDLLEMDEEEKANFSCKNLGIIFQNHYLIPSLTVVENITLPLLIAGETTKSANDKAYNMLKRIQLLDKAGVSPLYLSNGQQQRVAIARAIIHDPKIIVCDEPTSFLDQASGSQMIGFLKDLAINFSKCVLVVTHDHRVFPFADRIVFINDGQLEGDKENA